MADSNPIGNRRWLCYLSRRSDSNDPSGPSLIQSYSKVAQVWADIQPLGPMTYYAALDTDAPVSHKIFIRWRSDVRLFDCIIRTTTDPEGNAYEEVYMIRRSEDWQGRKRFLLLEARLETRGGQVDLT